jgi:hypothetical protein
VSQERCEGAGHVWTYPDNPDPSWQEQWSTGQCECGRFVGPVLRKVDMKPWMDAPAPERWPTMAELALVAS